MEQSYLEELIILTIVGSLLIIAKLTACCFSLGLHESHKNINLRQDSLSIAKLNHLKLERVSDVKREESVTCDCKCTRSPKRSLPVQPKISPKLEIPVKTLVCVKIHSAESHSQNSNQ